MLAHPAPAGGLAGPATLLVTAAALSWPRLPTEGTEPWVGMATWLAAWAAGLAGGWLGGRWWGSSSAAMVCGVAWQAAVVQAPPAPLAILALLPLGWGLLIRTVADPYLPASLAAAVAPAALLALGERAAHAYLLLAVPALVAQARASGLLGPLAAAYGVTGLALLLSAPYLAWTQGQGPGLPAVEVPVVAALLATGAAWRARRNLRRLALPLLAVVGGLGLPGASASTALGVAALAAGLATDGDRRLGWAAVAAVLGEAAIRLH